MPTSSRHGPKPPLPANPSGQAQIPSHSSGQAQVPSNPFGRMQEEESLRGLLRVLRKRKYFILAAALGSLVLGLLICLFMHPQYTSKATLLVAKDNSADLEMGGIMPALGGEDDVKTEIQTHVAVLQDDTILLKVADELNLRNVTPYKNRSGWPGENAQIKAEQNLPLEEAPLSRERILAMIRSRLKISATQDTRLIVIEYRDPDPERSARIANSIVNTYIQEYLAMHYKSTARASEWLTSQLGNLKANVGESQHKLSDYERKTGLSVLALGLSAEGSNASGAAASSGGGGTGAGSSPHLPEADRLSALNAEMTAAQANRIAKEAIFRLTQTQSPEVVLGLAGSGLTSMGSGSSVTSQGSGLAVLQTLREQEAAIKVNYGDISTKYGAKNPRLDELQGQMTALDSEIGKEMKRLNQRAQNDFTIAQKTEDAIRFEYVKQEHALNDLNDRVTELEILAGEATASRTLYEELSSKLQEAGVTAGVKAANLDPVDPARTPALPSRPNWEVYPAVALGAGLLLGIAGAFIQENLDDAIVTVEHVQQLSSYPVLANIPFVRVANVTPLASPPGYREPSLLLRQPSAPAAESYRALRTAIQLLAIDSAPQVILVSSSLPGEGKGTICYNLAIAFAQQDKRVLIVDADMRKSKMNKLFRVERAPGLSQVLSGSVAFAAAVRRHNILGSLSLLPSGIAPPNPAELLASSRWDELIAHLRGQYDFIFIDSPPILLVTDAVLISSKADSTIVVIRSGVTTRPVLARITEAMDRSLGRQLGFVLNAVNTKSAEHYYAYGYYGNSKYYGGEDSRS